MAKKEPNPKLEEKLIEKPEDNIPLKTEGEVKRRHRRTQAEIRAAKEGQTSTWRSDVPNPAIMALVQLPYNGIVGRISKKYPDWKDVTDLVEQIKLTSEEAASIALPATQLLNYYFPNQPEIAYVWLNMILSTAGIAMEKMKLLTMIKEIVDAKKPAQPEGEKVNG